LTDVAQSASVESEALVDDPGARSRAGLTDSRVSHHGFTDPRRRPNDATLPSVDDGTKPD
jgi:hypothetical protein